MPTTASTTSRPKPPAKPEAGDSGSAIGVAHLCAEFWPYARTGGLAEAVRGIAKFQVAAGLPTMVFTPYYRTVRERFPDIQPLGEPFTVRVGPREETVRLLHRHDREGGYRVFFVDHPGYFDRPGIYGEGGGDYADNARRFGFFAMAVLAALPRVWTGRLILHPHDWHTALAAVYLRTLFAGQPFYDRTACVLSVHNAGYQGHFPYEVLADLGLPVSLYDFRYMEWYNRVNILKGGLVFSDFATTVSPNHAHELRTRFGGFGLHDTFTALQDRFVGILNGIDYEIWNPQSDPDIEAHYSIDDPSGKVLCKAWLQDASGLTVDPDIPLFAMTARLVEQKGLDLILGAGLLTQAPAQFVILGQGEPRYETALSELAARAPDRIAVRLDFTEQREHKLLAGADLLLMPSQYEPCGLTQMRAQRYGALPVARRVGGLADTIEDQVTGFLFDEYQPWALEDAVRRAIQLFGDRKAWPWHMREAMSRDFGWERSVEKYLEVYRRALAVHAESR